MTDAGGIGRAAYRLALAAAKRRDLSAALAYAEFACLLMPNQGDAAYEDAARLAEICRYELGDAEDPWEAEAVYLLARQKKWKAAALAVRRLSRQSVRLLTIQGCLWALAKHDARAADCFARVLEKDCGNRLAAEALAEIVRRRKCFWRFF
ncbi:MAG: hypothetical protein LBD78_11485 [Spirochaetaceae bacterium]|jgi:hypothetical protein|nr:hypothetical protein [Spirochaetaceae bacterium]